STVADCISSLKAGAACVMNGGSSATMSIPTNVTCSTACASSNGLCDPNTYSTVAKFVAGTKNGLCVSTANGGGGSLTLKFGANVGNSASCSTRCSDTLTGSCDANGFGAFDGSTVADYIIGQLNGSTTCSVGSRRSVSDTASIAIDASQTGAACQSPNSPIW